MRQQRTISQRKGQDKIPEEQLSEDRQSTQKRIQSNDSKDDPRSQKKIKAQTRKIQEIFNKDLKELKNKQMNSTTEMKNTLKGINSRINKGEECISELEDKMVEITAVEQNKEKRMKRNEDNLRDF